MEDLMQVFDDVNEAFEKEDFRKCLKLLENAWESIPNNKSDIPESFIVANTGVDISLQIKDLSSADNWFKKLEECIDKRQDVGDIDFVKGLIALEKDLIDEASEHFKIANTKSEGRCFLGENSKYLQYLK